MKRIATGMISLLASVCALAQHAPQAADGEVKNVIYMIGDGMGLAHVSMLMIEGDYEPTAFDRAQNVALITTHSANNRVADSAASGTALAAGCKTNNSVLGLTPDGRPCVSMMTRAIRRGMPAGLVVTSYLPHATPAAFFAHTANRDDKAQIVEQFVESGIDVAFGGGRRYFEPKETPVGGSAAERLRAAGYRVVYDLEEAEPSRSGRVVGLCADRHLPPARDRGDYLTRATDKALELLQNNDTGRKGFFLMVEGSQIDFISHEHDSAGVLAEMRDFEQAVAAAMDFADRTPGTLVVVTADHETAGLAVVSNNADFTLSESGIDYRYATTGHSGVMVPVFLYGSGAERINGVMDNTELAKKLMEMLGLE